MTPVLLSVLMLAAQAAAPSAPAATVPANHYATDENLNSVLWMQTSIEYRTLAEQTYRAAEAMLKPARKDRRWTAATEQTTIPHKGKRTAVILDLDETVIDNSAFNARQAHAGLKPMHEAFNTSWAKWEGENTKLPLVPGAEHYIRSALSMGIHVVFISNRTCDPSKPETDPTIRILEHHKLLPHAAKTPLNSIVYCDDGSGSKTKRREKVAAGYRILQLIGDDIGDMIAIPRDYKTPQQRMDFIKPYLDRFGKSWFQLPNPVYGSWERATVPDKQALERIIEQKKAHLRLGIE